MYNSDTKRKFDRNIKHMQEDKNTELREERVESRTVTPSQSSSLLKDLMIPISIVIAGIFVAGGLYFSGSPVSKPVAGNPNQPAAEVDNTNKVKEVTADDHIKGSIDAPIKIVAYSDFECPFCKRYHETMTSIMKKYGDSGEVAFIFRQFPLDALHPVKARAVAVASECANELGGNNTFWKFADRYFELTLTNNQTDIEKVIPQIVTEIGLDKTAFTSCFSSDRHNARIEADTANAAETGGRGTPWSILIGPSGKTYPINGALPQASIEQMIEVAKKEA